MPKKAEEYTYSTYVEQLDYSRKPDTEALRQQEHAFDDRLATHNPELAKLIGPINDRNWPETTLPEHRDPTDPQDKYPWLHPEKGNSTLSGLKDHLREATDGAGPQERTALAHHLTARLAEPSIAPLRNLSEAYRMGQRLEPDNRLSTDLSEHFRQNADQAMHAANYTAAYLADHSACDDQDIAAKAIQQLHHQAKEAINHPAEFLAQQLEAGEYRPDTLAHTLVQPVEALLQHVVRDVNAPTREYRQYTGRDRPDHPDRTHANILHALYQQEVRDYADAFRANNDTFEKELAQSLCNNTGDHAGAIQDALDHVEDMYHQIEFQLTPAAQSERLHHAFQTYIESSPSEKHSHIAEAFVNSVTVHSEIQQLHALPTETYPYPNPEEQEVHNLMTDLLARNTFRTKQEIRENLLETILSGNSTPQDIQRATTDFQAATDARRAFDQHSIDPTGFASTDIQQEFRHLETEKISLIMDSLDTKLADHYGPAKPSTRELVEDPAHHGFLDNFLRSYPKPDHARIAARLMETA